MLSRVANNLIWFERYMERGSSIINLLKVNFYANQEAPEMFSWMPIIKNYAGDDVSFHSENALECIEFMIFNPDNQSSLVNIVTKARENARSVQEHLSREIWFCINNYYLFITDKNLSKKLQKEDPILFLEKLESFHLMFYGNMDITQERGPSYYFMGVGRFLERVIQISDFTSLKLIEISKTTDRLEQSIYWKNLLLAIGGYQLYLKKHKSAFKKNHIISLVFQDEFFPKSVYYCISKMNRHIHTLMEDKELDNNNIEFLLGKLESKIKYATIDSINEQGLASFIDDIKESIKNISLNINMVYFSHIN